jgi:hypothetical protein
MFTHSISTKPQQRPKNRRLLQLLTNLGKKPLPLPRKRLKSFLYIFFFDFLHNDPSNDFRLCKFFAKGLKSERDAES